MKLREWHLTATPQGESKSVDFVAVYRPYRLSETPPKAANLERTDKGYVVTAEQAGKKVRVVLPKDDAAVEGPQLNSTGGIVAEIAD